MKPGRKPLPLPLALARGWCDRCRNLSVRGDTGACTRCGAGLARGYEYVEADDEVLLAEGVVPPSLAEAGERRRRKAERAGQTAFSM
jgi:hypothetical protein